MSISKEQILEKIKEVSKKENVSKLQLSKFSRISGVSRDLIYKYFRTWEDAVKEAGLTPFDTHTRFNDAEMFLNLKEVFEKKGGVSNRRQFQLEYGSLSKYRLGVYKKHFGNWNNTLSKFRDWIIETKQDFQYTNQLPNLNANKSIENLGISNISKLQKAWKPLGKTEYGSLLNFRGLQHAPVNEQGVVFLFGMIAHELGFVVESIKTGFPDCEGKRRISFKPERWERVRIEFEYQSSNFKAHAHETNGCDIVVCWINDWEDCPLEIIELKSVLTSLK